MSTRREPLRFEKLACFSIKGERAALNESPCGLVRFSRCLTDDEWEAFAKTCDAFAGRFGPCKHTRGMTGTIDGYRCMQCGALLDEF